MRYLVILFVLFHVNTIMASNGPEVVLTTGHNDQINAMAVSNNSKFLASAGNNQIIKIWDVASNKEYRSIYGTDGRVNFLKFSPDNIHLLGTSSSNELIVWNVLTGEEVVKTTASTLTYNLSFYNEGKNVAFLDSDNKLSILDVFKGSVEVVNTDIYCAEINVDETNQIAYLMDMTGKIYYFDLKTKTITREIQLFDKYMFSMVPTKITRDGKYIVSAYFDDVIRVFDTKKGEFIFKSKKMKNKIMAFEIDVFKPHVYYTLHSGDVYFYDYEKQKELFTFKDPSFIANCITSYSTGEAVIVANYNVIRFFDLKSKKVFKYLRPQVSKIFNMAYDQQGKYLAVANNKVKIYIWDLRLNKIVDSLNGFFPCEFSPDGKELISMSYTTNLVTWNAGNWKKKKEYSSENELIQKIAYSPDGKYIAGGGYQNIIKIWDRESGKLIKKLKGHTSGISALHFHPTEPILASGSYDGKLKIWDYLHEKELKSFEDQIITISGVKFSPDGKLLASSSWDKSVVIRNTSDWSIKHKLTEHKSSVWGLDFNKTGEVLMSFSSTDAVSKSDNSVVFYNVESGEKICQIKDHQSTIWKGFFDKDADYVFTCSDDGTVKISDYKQKKVIATYVGVGSSDFLIYTPENYYIASKKALNSVAFRIDGKLVSFDQFDIYLNRPDIVAKEIGKSPPQLIKAYNYLYKKRLRKYNLDEGSINLDYHIPSLLKENNTPLLTKESTVKVTVKAWDDIYNINQISIYVNGTPIFGDNGFVIREKVKSYRKSFEIPLLEGNNKIQIECLNSNGAKSIAETFEIIKEETEAKNDLYIVTIGVSNYKDERFKLTYPTKDAKDMMTKLTASNDLYANIHSKMLLDEQMTLSNFIALEDFFKNCKHNDIAIIFMAGHGVLDANFDYYYGTYDMDFNDPSNLGLPYDKVHELLNKIKAYRKLLIMDTCHSGELDKEEIEQGPEPEVDDGDIEFRGAGISVREKEGFGFENSVDLMADLFSDTRKGSGAIVISSAGGAEYAMESDEWKNGLFTYAFLNGFEIQTDNYGKSLPKADYNKNGFVEVSEIRRFVNESVKQLSGGKQIPSSREENISQDYPVFKK